MKKTKSYVDGELSKNESILAKNLKSLCDNEGKEKDPKLSAEILCKLGLIYKDKSPDMFSLIRSSALLNAALVRQPANANEVQRDLNQLHFHVLELANAREGKFHLSKFAKTVREKVKLMRKHAKLSVNKLSIIPDDFASEEILKLERKKIKDVEALQTQITEQYTGIMKYISDKCIEVMGTPPCQYAITGMGSIARKEITPYSDFEHVIVLEDLKCPDDSKQYQTALEYFRWFSILFHLTILCLGETLIPCLAIPSLNSNEKKENNWFYDVHTPSGVSFDGMVPYACKFPLGRQQITKDKPWSTELIRPVQKMLEYLDENEDIKNGYHLADILTKICFVSGDIVTYNSFAKGVRERLLQKRSLKSRQLIKQQLNEDLENFHISRVVHDMASTLSINIKRIIYRSSTLFICALGRLHSVVKSPSSCFDIIEVLKKKKVITLTTAHQLAFAVSIACEIRLKVYCLRRGQNDVIERIGRNSEGPHNVTLTFISAVGEKSLVYYLCICWGLQEMIIQHKYQVLELSLDIRILLCRLLCLYTRITKEWENSKTRMLSYDSMNIIGNAYHMTKNDEAALLLFKSLRESIGQISSHFNLELYNQYVLVNRSIIMCTHRKDAETCKIIRQIIENYVPNPLCDPLSLLYDQLALYYMHVEHDYSRAICVFVKGKMVLNDTNMDFDISAVLTKECEYNSSAASFFFNIADCLYFIDFLQLALNIAEKSLEIYCKYRYEIDDECRIGHVYFLLGRCQVFLKNHHEAAKYLRQSLTILKTFFPDPEEILKCNEIHRLLNLCSDQR